MRAHRRAAQLGNALDHRDLAVHMDVRAHARQLLGVAEAAVPDALGDDARALCQTERRGHLRLHVGREARIGQGLDIGAGERARAAHEHRVVILGHLDAHLLELGGDALQMTRDDVFDQHRTAAGRDRRHKGAGLDLVRDDRIVRAVQALDAADLDHVRARALDVRAHGVEEVRQIDDVRLLGAVLHDGLALGQHRGEHDVHRRADRDNVEINVCAVQALFGRLGADVTALGQGHRGAERLEALDMLVDRAHAAEIAAARHGDLGVAVFAQQHAEQIIGGAQLALELVRLEAGVAGVLDLDGRCVDQTDLRAQLAHDLKLEGHVDDLGHVLNADRAIRQQRCRNDRDGGVLRPGDGHFAVERFTAVDDILCQTYLLLTPASRGCPRPLVRYCKFMCAGGAWFARKNSHQYILPQFLIKESLFSIFLVYDCLFVTIHQIFTEIGHDLPSRR